MVRIRKRDPECAAAADAYVRGHQDGTLFHLSQWSRAIGDSMGHQVHDLVAERDGVVVGLLPLIHIDSRLFGSHLISSAFAVHGGPLTDDAEVDAALDQAAWAIAQQVGAESLEYRSARRLRPDWPAKTELYADFKRPIAADPDANMKAIPRKQRAMVRKAIDLGLSAVVDRDVDRHFAVYAESVRNLGTPVFPKALFAALLAAFGDDCDILTVFHQGAPVASVLSLYFRGEVLPYYGGGTREARALAANDYMYWALMEHARKRGCTVFDFGRSKLGTGAYAFKKNWGFEPRPLCYEYRLAEGVSMPEINPLNPKYRLMIDLWRRLPLAVANRLGPLIARNLG